MKGKGCTNHPAYLLKGKMDSAHEDNCIKFRVSSKDPFVLNITFNCKSYMY